MFEAVRYDDGQTMVSFSIFFLEAVARANQSDAVANCLHHRETRVVMLLAFCWCEATERLRMLPLLTVL
jgi:hypothetical protein